MKQNLLQSLRLRFALLVALLCSLGTGTAWATDATASVSISTYASANSWSSGTAYSSVTIDTYVSASGVSGGNNNKYYSSNNSWRHYEGDSGAITISVTGGATLKSITFTYTAGNNGVLKYSESNVASGTACTAVEGETSATFSVNHSSGTKKGNVQITAISVTYTSGGGSSTVANPAFLPDGSVTYTTKQDVEISCATDGAKIYYTTNGDTPDEESTPYTGAISITTSGTVLKAIAYKDGMTQSSVAYATYTIKPTKPTVSAVGPTVTITGADGCTFYYTTDNSEPSNTSDLYSAPFNLNEDCTIKAIAYDTYGNASDVTSFTFKYFPLVPKNINSGYYEKVTDVDDLENGDAILIVNEDYNKAMSTTQNKNNRGEVGVTISTNTIYSPASATAQKLVLVKKTEEVNSVDTDVFYFYTGSGYLYAAGASSNNYLKTEDTPDVNNNARATIAISNGNATITFKGSSSHNVMQYNNSSSIFSCYGSASQDAIQIYREVAHSVAVAVTDAGYATFASDYALDFTGLSVNAYIAAANGTKGVNFTQVYKVPANTGVLLYKDGGTGVTPVDVPVFNGAGADNVSSNIFLRGEDEAVASEDGTLHNYILNNGSKGLGFYRAAGNTVAANRAYIQIDWSSSVKEFISIDFDSIVDGIGDVRSKMDDVRGEIFNLAGQKMSRLQKGINIVNGRKVLVK